MEVPEHIYVTGTRPNQKPSETNHKHVMAVPSRILVNAAVDKARPTLVNNADPQSTSTDEFATISEYIAPNELKSSEDSGIPHLSKEYSNQSSIAVEEDPLRELKNVRRHVGRLKVRVTELEKENIDRDNMINWLKKGMIANSIAIVLVITTVIFGHNIRNR